MSTKKPDTPATTTASSGKSGGGQANKSAAKPSSKNPSSVDLKEHDKQFHPHGFDPNKDTCKFRERLSKIDDVDQLYAVSDIHHTGIDAVDTNTHGTIMIAGDFMDKAKHHEDFKDAEKWFNEDFKKWCAKHQNQNIVIIGGNCDKWLYENRDKVEWPSNVTYLDDSAAEVNGMKVYGTSWCPRNLNGAWEVDSKDLEKEFAKIPEGLDVLITHAPPRIEGSDIDHDNEFDRHFGSPELTKAILEKKPKLVLCGHVHSGSHKPVKIGDTIVMNVSRVDDDRFEKSWHGQTIGVEKGADGLGFVVDMEDEKKISLGKKEDIPEDIRNLKKDLVEAAKSINRHIDYRDYRPNKEAISMAEASIKKAKDALAKFDHPKRKMLENAIAQFEKSKKSGWKERMSRVGKLFDGDNPPKYSGSLFSAGGYSPYKSISHSSHGGGGGHSWGGYGGGGWHYGYGGSSHWGGGSTYKHVGSSSSGKKSGMSADDILSKWMAKDDDVETSGGFPLVWEPSKKTAPKGPSKGFGGGKGKDEGKTPTKPKKGFLASLVDDDEDDEDEGYDFMAADAASDAFEDFSDEMSEKYGVSSEDKLFKVMTVSEKAKYYSLLDKAQQLNKGHL